MKIPGLNLPEILTVEPQSVRITPTKHGTCLQGVNLLEVSLGDAQWFGLGALYDQRLPLNKVTIPEGRLLSADPMAAHLGIPGVLGILEPFLFNSKGLGILVEGDDITFAFNPPRGLPTASDRRVKLSDSTSTNPVLKFEGKNLNITIFSCADARLVVQGYWDGLSMPPPPPPELLGRPMWTTWANFKNDISQETILQFARDILSHGFPSGSFGIDAKWQQTFGDLDFDSVRFPDPAGMISELTKLGFSPTLWCVPFFNRDSRNFSTAIERQFVMKEANSQKPYVGKWWEGEAAFLDLANPEALAWHMENLQSVASKFKLSGFKFDAGEAAFYANHEIFPNQNQGAHCASVAYVRAISSKFPWSDARTAWKTQDCKVLLRQWDKRTAWGFDNGLASCITQAITLNLLGYPFSFPDMIGGNEYHDDRADAELMIRWVQAVAPMPFMQFSIPPWRFGKECNEICLRYVKLHRELSSLHNALLCSKGPLLRPVWWMAPDSPDALHCEDEYLVGDDLLVAPVIEKGSAARDIWLPPGQWKPLVGANQVHRGPKWLGDYPAPLETLPLFARVN